jgi:transcriptional regulator
LFCNIGAIRRGKGRRPDLVIPAFDRRAGAKPRVCRAGLRRVRYISDTMYMPPHFAARDRALAVDLMRAHPLATVVSTDETGFPFLSHLPLHLEQRDAQLVLLGHCAKPNAQWRHLKERPRALVSFRGPQAYLSPRVYPELARVPTWNYLAVQCTVEARLIEQPLDKDRLLKKLIGDHDPDYIAQWIALDPEFQHKMLAGIVGLELLVLELQCKLKLNQHRPESHARMREIYGAGNEDARALVAWMDRLGMGGACAAAGAAVDGGKPA